MANVHRIEGAGKSRDLDTLTGMRTALSWSEIDRDIATQPTVKLPDRRFLNLWNSCLLYTSPSPRDRQKSRMPSSA